MDTLLADIQLKQCHYQNQTKEDKCRGTRPSLIVACKRVIYESDHCVQPSGIVRRTHRLTEDTYYAGVFLESADESGYDHVCDHR